MIVIAKKFDENLAVFSGAWNVEDVIWFMKQNGTPNLMTPQKETMALITQYYRPAIFLVTNDKKSLQQFNMLAASKDFKQMGDLLYFVSDTQSIAGQNVVRLLRLADEELDFPSIRIVDTKDHLGVATYQENLEDLTTEKLKDFI